MNNISEVTVGSMGISSTNITKSYLENGGKCSQTPELEIESGFLTIAGISNILKAPMKIAVICQAKHLPALGGVFVCESVDRIHGVRPVRKYILTIKFYFSTS